MIGRDRKEGWLQLDNQRNVSGQTVGGLVGLNVMSELYVGGYQEYNMAGLPGELTFTNSFQGLNNYHFLKIKKTLSDCIQVDLNIHEIIINQAEDNVVLKGLLFFFFSIFNY